MKKTFSPYLLLFSVILFFICLSGSIHVNATTHTPQDSINEISFKKLAGQLESKHNIRIFYEPKWFKGQTFDASLIDLSLEQALTEVFSDKEFSFSRIEDMVVIMPQNYTPPSGSEDQVTVVGNISEYGKYSKATLQGTITDAKTGEAVAGATVSIPSQNKGATTNSDGQFSMELPVGNHEIQVSLMGYEDTRREIKLVSDGSLILQLFEESVQMKEVVITSQGRNSNVSGSQMSVSKIETEAIKKMPMTMGEVDVIKSVSSVPGVQSTGEFGSGFNVRGSGSDQNLILIEGVPIFNSSHVFGLTSAINADIVKDLTLYKGGIPAEYGERTSSVLDIDLGIDNKEEFQAEGGIGLLNSRLTLETPLSNNKASLQIGGRTSYSDWILNELPDPALKNSSASFYDLNGRFDVNINSNNKLTFFGYYGSDRFSFDDETDYEYQNILGSVRWQHTFNNRLSSNLLLGYSEYDNEIRQLSDNSPAEGNRVNSDIRYQKFKWKFNWDFNSMHNFKFGINGVYYDILTGNLHPYGSQSDVIAQTSPREKAVEYAPFISDQIKFNDKLTLNVGLRYAGYGLMEPKEEIRYEEGSPKGPQNIADTVTYPDKTFIQGYSGIEPRISATYQIDNNSSVKASYNRMHQFLNLISNTAVMSPRDVWKLSDNHVSPMITDQVAGGYFRNFDNNKYETSIELYAKKSQNLPYVKNNTARIITNENLNADLLNLNGYSYGAELYVKKNVGRITGWMSYTYSRSKVRTQSPYPEEQINNNNYFNSNFDRPHNLTINANYKFNKRLSLGMRFIYNTGRPVTLPEQSYNYNEFPLLQYSSRNKYRMPDFHRLDISITLDESLKLNKAWKGSWSLSIMNVYGRNNPYSIYYSRNQRAGNNEASAYNLFKLFIVGNPLPTLTYNFKF